MFSYTFYLQKELDVLTTFGTIQLLNLINILFTQGARCFDHTERMWEERSCSQVFIFSMISLCSNWNILLFL